MLKSIAYVESFGCLENINANVNFVFNILPELHGSSLKLKCCGIFLSDFKGLHQKQFQNPAFENKQLCGRIKIHLPCLPDTPSLEKQLIMELPTQYLKPPDASRHTYTRAYMHTIHAFMHSIHANTHTCMHTYIHYIHTYKHTLHTYTHAYIHARIKTYMQ